jgi:Fic family protein/molecular chaperone DnaK (HSP70)
MKILDYDLGGNRGALPTAIALDGDGKRPPLFGDNAFEAPRGYALITNWKLLLGKTELQIQKERNENAVLDFVLQHETLDSIAYMYFSHLFEKVKKENHFEKLPEVIIGIPSANVETEAARRRFRKTIEGAFSRLDLPKPHFFPEPFAVFQYHWFRGDLEDRGRPLNVMIVDIGGGTTNVCIIQTSGHGRLARGGDNHKPHGVATFERGGSDLDGYILDRVVKSTRIREVAKANLSARKAKEWISTILNERELWLREEEAESVSTTISVEDQGDWPVTGRDLISVIQHRFWPNVKATIEESLKEARSAKLARPIGEIDAVIFAGGTCQIDLVRILFKRDFGPSQGLGNYRVVLSPEYDRAVAGGLAVEACANSRLHETKPTRVAPYVQSDILFEVGHSPTSIGPPVKVSLKEGPASCGPVVGEDRSVTIINAPISISDLVGKKIEWQFQLRQPSDHGYIRIMRKGEEDLQRIQPPIAVRIAPRGQQAGSQCRLRMLFDDDEVADVGLVAWNRGEGNVYYPAARLDLHDLNAMKGEVFVGLDFGTTNTFIAQVDASSIANDALPSRYIADDSILARARSLSLSAKAFSARTHDADELLRRYESTVLRDYIYHSNRIEGSELTRGQTQRVLADVPGPESLHSRDIKGVIQNLAFVDDHGNVQAVSRPIKDEVAAVNLRDAFLQVQEMAVDARPLTRHDLKAIHSLVARGDESAMPGQFRKGNVKIGQTTFVPPEGSHVDGLMEEMCRSFDSEDFNGYSPIYQAVYAHARFVSIHPFQDGNGRLARLVANYFLWRANMPSIMLPWENRERYYDALEECNSFETSNRGNLTDLATLFCDLFEDALNNVEALQIANRQGVKTDTPRPDDPVVRAPLSKSNRLTNLLNRISDSRRAANLEAQYDVWKSSFEALLADVRESSVLVDNAFHEGWGGGAKLREFPIIDMETFRAIREGRPYSRTWYCSLKLILPNTTELIVLYFSRASRQLVEVDARLNATVSLGISRMVQAQGRYISTHQEEWSRVKEISHDGAQMGLCFVDDRILRHTVEQSEVSEWFALLMEDCTQVLGGYDLAS